MRDGAIVNAPDNPHLEAVKRKQEEIISEFKKMIKANKFAITPYGS
jgi:hypothetical protein